MRLGWVGLGKLGGPVARLLAEKHTVMGYDINPRVRARAGINVANSIAEMAGWCPDLLFVAVPTPHEPRFDGTSPLPDDRADFDYSILHGVLHEISDAAPRTVTAVVVSTCLPDTYGRMKWGELDGVRYVHSPSFVGMGNVEHDFRYPEFWLIGADGPVPQLRELYEEINDSRVVIETDVTTAEAIKVSYNTMISVKIAVANTWSEVCARVGADVDQIERAWRLAGRRITSAAYLRAGMGDGGPCHPRDLIAMSWLARELDLSFDLFGALAEQREAHTRWLASMIPDGARLFGGPFKPGVSLLDGSPAVLLTQILTEQGKGWVLAPEPFPGDVNVIVTAEPRYAEIVWPDGSTVIDPFGIIPDQPGVTVRRPGRLP